MKTFGILAYPAKHSLSPLVHNAAFKALNIDAQYMVFEIPETELKSFMEKVIHDPIKGLSVSLPYKETVMQYINEIDDNAMKIGAVNTVLNKGGFLYGYNTDADGFIKSLKEAHKSLRDKKVVIIGAGGAVRAMAYGLIREKAKIHIFNRHEKKAVEIADEFSGTYGIDIGTGDLEEMWNISKADILVQATSIWTLNPDMDDEEAEAFLPTEYIERFHTVMDIVYIPLETPLIKKARALGKTVITGEKMFLYQAIEQFKIWTDIENPPVEAMEKALNEALY